MDFYEKYGVFHRFFGLDESIIGTQKGEVYMPGDQELENRLKSIEKRLSRLEQSRPGTVSGGDVEFFGHYSQLETLELRVEALIRFFEESHSGVRRFVDEECTKAKNAEAAKVEKAIDSVYGGGTD
jgi:hypothetical protein